MNPLFEFLLRQGDTTLILSHRLSEWCGKGPILEEDIALANIALDLLGQTQMWLGYAAEIEGLNRSADELAFTRDAWDFRCLLLAEQPNGDFGQTIMRQYLYDAFQLLQLNALEKSSDPRVAEIAMKSAKEVAYHVERSRDTVVTLGDGTDESRERMQTALTLLWPFAMEMFVTDGIDDEINEMGLAPKPSSLQGAWITQIRETMSNATLDIPEDNFAHRGGKSGVRHTEHLGHILASMQFLQRAYPGAEW
jgi:ring-1,2-phenylacetyl-CoA epoxidase subunit PaaC